MRQPSKIECAKCHEPATLTDLHCKKCAGRIVKHCAACGWVLSVMKKYCDSCGDPQAVVSNTPMPRQIQPAKPLPPFKQREPEPEKPRKDPPPEPPKKKEREEPEIKIPKVEKEPLHPVKGINLSSAEEEKPKRPSSFDQGAKNPPDDIPRTIIRRLPAKDKSERENPQERRERPHEERRPDKHRHEGHDRHDRHERRDGQGWRRRSSERSRTDVRTLVRERPIFSTLLGLLLLLTTAGVYFTFWKSRRTPERLLMKTTQAYLTALKEKNFGAAYHMLSAASQSACTLERFQTLQENLSWNFDKLRITSLSPERALIKYELLVSGRAVAEDWLHFVREGSKWRRAYWWPLMQKIEEALADDDTGSASGLVETAARINPLDPMLPAYFCEIAYTRKDHASAETFCRRALDMAKIYPSRLGPDGELRLKQILADTYRNGTGSLEKAIKQYEILLTDPMLRGRKNCDIRLANADTHYLLQRYDKAIEQFREAKKSCRQEEEVAYLDRSLRILTGKGGKAAVAAAQNHHMPGDKLPLLQYRRKTHRDLARRLKTKLVKYRVAERWKSRHVSGADYEVVVKNSGVQVLTARVDLWTRKVKVDIHVQ